MLLVPELKSPPGCQSKGADQNDLDGDRKHFASEKVGYRRLMMSRLSLGLVPFFRLRDGPSNPKNQKRGKNPDQENPAGILTGHEVHRHASQQNSDIHPGLQHRGNPRSPSSRPGLSE